MKALWDSCHHTPVCRSFEHLRVLCFRNLYIYSMLISSPIRSEFWFAAHSKVVFLLTCLLLWRNRIFTPNTTQEWQGEFDNLRCVYGFRNHCQFDLTTMIKIERKHTYRPRSFSAFDTSLPEWMRWIFTQIKAKNKESDKVLNGI